MLMKVITFKNIRIVILLSLLAAVASYTQDQQLSSTSWYQAAEIMAGRIPLSETQSNMPKDLHFSLVGETTTKEINWISVR